MHATRRQLERDGYLVLPGFVSGSACERLRARRAAGRGVRAGGSTGVHHHEQTRMRGRVLPRLRATRSASSSRRTRSTRRRAARRTRRCSINKIGHALHDLDPVFDAVLAHAGARRAGGGAGRRAAAAAAVDVHLQAAAHRRRGGLPSGLRRSSIPSPPACLGFWFALEDATLENGCMWALPGGHRAAAEVSASSAPGRTTRPVDARPEPPARRRASCPWRRRRARWSCCMGSCRT